MLLRKEQIELEDLGYEIRAIRWRLENVKGISQGSREGMLRSIAVKERRMAQLVELDQYGMQGDPSPSTDIGED